MQIKIGFLNGIFIVIVLILPDFDDVHGTHYNLHLHLNTPSNHRQHSHHRPHSHHGQHSHHRFQRRNGTVEGGYGYGPVSGGYEGGGSSTTKQTTTAKPVEVKLPQQSKVEPVEVKAPPKTAKPIHNGVREERGLGQLLKALPGKGFLPILSGGGKGAGCNCNGSDQGEGGGGKGLFGGLGGGKGLLGAFPGKGLLGGGGGGKGLFRGLGGGGGRGKGKGLLGGLPIPGKGLLSGLGGGGGKKPGGGKGRGNPLNVFGRLNQDQPCAAGLSSLPLLEHIPLLPKTRFPNFVPSGVNTCEKTCMGDTDGGGYGWSSRSGGQQPGKRLFLQGFGGGKGKGMSGGEAGEGEFSKCTYNWRDSLTGFPFLLFHCFCKKQCPPEKILFGGYLNIGCENVSNQKSRCKCPYGMDSFKCTINVLPVFQRKNAYYCTCCNKNGEYDVISSDGESGGGGGGTMMEPVPVSGYGWGGELAEQGSSGMESQGGYSEIVSVGDSGGYRDGGGRINNEGGAQETEVQPVEVELPQESMRPYNGHRPKYEHL